MSDGTQAPCDLSLLQDTVAHYKSIPGSLITVLQKAQEIYGYLSEDVLLFVATALKLPPARVYGVATFYTQFRFTPVGKYLLMLCEGTACHVNGAQSILRTIEQELHLRDGETTPDGLFTLKTVACLGCCSLSPVMMVNENTYGSLTPQKVTELLQRLREEAQEVTV